MRSRLGFGTSGIMGARLTTAGRLRLLEMAWAQGIRHFDTAPLYGMGDAEALLGRFLRGRRDTVSITTKFGLLPATPPRPLRPLIPLARGLNRRLLLPLRQRVSLLARSAGPQRQARSAADAPETTAAGQPLSTLAATDHAVAAAPSRRQPPIPYSPAVLRQHLEASLRNLQTDHVDYYLLHEGHADYLNAEFLEALEQLVQEGKIRHYGVGTGRWQCRCLVEAFPDQPWILQIPDSLLDRDTAWFAARSSGPLFTHSAMRLEREDARRELRRLLPRWASLSGRDPEDPALAGELLLTLALSRNPTGCVVFSSGSDARIRGNAAALLAWADGTGPTAAQLRDCLPDNALPSA